MNKYIAIALLGGILSTSSYAQQLQLSNPTSKVVHEEKDPELLKVMDKERGVIKEHIHVENDKNRLSFFAALSPIPSYLSKFLSFETNLSRKMGEFWGALYFEYTKSQFQSIADTPSNASSNPHAESNNGRSKESESDMWSLGVGAGLVSPFELFKAEHVYQSFFSYLGYLSLDDRHLNETYLGIQFKAEYGLFYRMTSHTHMGLKMSYILGMAQRGEVTPGETRRDRRIYLSYPKISFDSTFYF